MKNLNSSDAQQPVIDVEIDDFGKIRYEICKSLDSNKSEDILMLNLKPYFTYDMWFVIATALSNTHLKKLVQDIVFFLKKRGIYNSYVPNDLDYESGWVALDYGEIIVHVFIKEKRTLYDLEGLWSKALTEAYP
jgi:ribosome-associated protein